MIVNTMFKETNKIKFGYTYNIGSCSVVMEAELWAILNNDRQLVWNSGHRQLILEHDLESVVN